MKLSLIIGLLLLLTPLVFAKRVLEVRGDKFTFDLVGIEEIKIGDKIYVVDEGKILVTAKVLKRTSDRALAVVVEQQRRVEKGFYIRIVKEVDVDSAFEEIEQAQEQEKKQEKKDPSSSRKKSKEEDFVVEPFLSLLRGSVSQDLEVDFPSAGKGEYEGDIAAIQFGLRGGYRWEKLFFMLQFSKSSGDLTGQKTTMELATGTSETTSPDAEYSKTDIGAVAGWRFTPKWRSWFSLLKSTTEATASSGAVTEYEGLTFLFGGGYFLFKGLSINLELGMTIHSSENGNSYAFTRTEGATTTGVYRMKETLILFGVSYAHGLF